MSDSDLRQLRGLIREALAHARVTHRSLESTLGIGHGNFGRLLDGSLELRVRHVLSIARALGVPPHQFLELGCPEALEEARRDLTEIVGSALPPERRLIALQTGAGSLDERIRAIVREELASQQDK